MSKFHINHFPFRPDPKLVKMWIARGYVDVAHKPGKGKARLYTWPEAVKISFMNLLSTSGMGPALSSQIADVIVQRASQRDVEAWPDADMMGHEQMQVFVYNVHDGKLAKHAFVSHGEYSLDEIREKHIRASLFQTIDADYLLMELAENLLHNKLNG